MATKGEYAMTDSLTIVRCNKCQRVLCEIDSKVKIKCRKCGHINYIIVKADQASQGSK